MNKEEFWQTIESVNHLVPDGNQEAVEEKMCEELLYQPTYSRKCTDIRKSFF